MSHQSFSDWQTFFKGVGSNYLHPKSFGDCSSPISIEEMYQHFKARMQQEQLEAGHPEVNCPARTGGSSCIC